MDESIISKSCSSFEKNEPSDEIMQKKIFSPELNPKNIFACHLCNLYSKYDYYGTRPLDRYLLSKSVEELTSEQKNQLLNLNNKKRENLILLEKCFITDDPFNPLKSSNYLILGSKCFECKKQVCVGNECSFFYYNKRFCFKCASDIIKDSKMSNEFPNELRNELIKILNKSVKLEESD